MPTRPRPIYEIKCCQTWIPIHANMESQCPECGSIFAVKQVNASEPTDPDEPPGGWEAYAEHSLSHDRGVNHVPYRGLVWSE